LGQKSDSFDAEIYLPRHINKDIKRKMLELAIELHYLVADGKLNDPDRVQALTELLEACAYNEGGESSDAAASNFLTFTIN